MISSADSRLAIVVIFLCLHIVIFLFELAVLAHVDWTGRWQTPLRQLIMPVSVALIGVTLVSIIFTSLGDTESIANQCTIGVDADVAGDGVRIAVWAQVGVLVLLSLLGSFHKKATGVKEIGAGLIITHVSSAIAILVQIGHGTLTSADALLGAMILDAQNMALSIQLGAKETLASRWQVGIVVLSQGFGLVVIPITISNFGRGLFATDDCTCLTVFWWGWITNCAELPSHEPLVFWLYYSWRCLAFCQSTFHSAWNTLPFDKAEKSERDRDQEVKSISAYGRITYPSTGKTGDATYKEYTSTVTLMYTIYALLSLTSMATAEMTMSRFDLHPTSQINSVGQIIALVIAIATIGRALWLFGKLIYDEKGGGFVWPFSLEPARDNLWSQPRYILAPNWDFSVNSISLGDVLIDPLKPNYRLAVEEEPASDRDSPVVNFQFAIANTGPAGEINRRTIRAAQVTTFTFLPTMEYIESRIADIATSPIFIQSRPRTVYIVTGKKIASGLSDGQEFGGVGGVLDVPVGAGHEQGIGVGALGVPVGAAVGAGHEQGTGHDVILAYRLHEIVLTRGSDRRVKKTRIYTKGALL